MALVTVGNTHKGDFYKDEKYGFEIPGSMGGVLLPHNFPKGNDLKKITVFYYNHSPSGPDYQKYSDVDMSDIIPFVCVADTWELLNKDLNTIIISSMDYYSQPSGWYSLEIELKRAIEPNEKCYVGFYGLDFLSRWDKSKSDLILYQFDYGDVIEGTIEKWTAEGGFKKDFESPFFCESPYNYSFYFTYDDLILSYDYSRNVNSSFPFFDFSCHYASFLRGAKNLIQPYDRAFRKMQLSKKLHDMEAGRDLAGRKIFFSKAVSGFVKNKFDVKRALFISKIYKDGIFFRDLFFRCIGYVRREFLGLLFNSSFYRNFIYSRAFFENNDFTDFVSKVIGFKRCENSFYNFIFILRHFWEFWRCCSCFASFKTLNYGFRIIYRLCNSLCSAWDFIRGKIREIPNIVYLFCPIDLELELNCNI